MKTVRSIFFGSSIVSSMAFMACINSIEEDRYTNLTVAGQQSESVVVGDLDWMDINQLLSSSAERQNGRFVANLNIPAVGSRCTGFLINANTIMTNRHCVSSAWMANNLTAEFRYERGVPYSQRQGFACSTFLGAVPGLDYALLECEGNPGETFGTPSLATANPSRNEAAYVIHQNCDYYTNPGCSPTKKYSPGVVTNVSSEIRHSADTLGGSSGSPLFSGLTHEVIGLHHAGSGNQGNGRGSHNYAVPMAQIIPDLISRFPNVTVGDQGGTGASSGNNAPPPPEPSDDLEPNDSAEVSTIATLPYSHRNVRIGDNDVDVFQVNVQEPIELKAEILFSHMQGDLEMSIHRTGPGSAALQTSFTVTDNEEINITLQESGLYYVVIFGYENAQADYQIHLEGILAHPDPPGGNSQPPSDSLYEPNNQPAEATLVEIPLAIESLEISPNGDEDHFRFEIDTEQNLNIRIDFSHTAGDLDMKVFDSQDTLVGKSDSVLDHEEITALLGPGSYRIAVYGYLQASGAYALAIHSP